MFGGGKAGKILDPVYGFGLAGAEPQGPSEFMVGNQKLQTEHAQDLWAASKPVATEGAKQVGQMTKTGTGEGIPIIQKLIQAMGMGQKTAAKGTAADIKRAGPSDPSLTRIQDKMAREGAANLSGIGPRIAAPFVSAGMGQALGGSQMAQSAFQSSGQAIARPFGAMAQPIDRSSPDYAQIDGQLASAYGGMSGGGGKSNGAGTTSASGGFANFGSDLL